MHPLLFMLSGWVGGLVFAFFIYTMVVSFGNIGKAIGMLMLVFQVSGSAGSYPLQVLPGFMQRLSPFLPITHAINAMRAAIAGHLPERLLGGAGASCCCSCRRCCCSACCCASRWSG